MKGLHANQFCTLQKRLYCQMLSLPNAIFFKLRVDYADKHQNMDF